MKNHRVYLSLFLGIIFSLSIYEYWLTDLIPASSKRLIVYIVLASLGGALGYFFLLEKWILPRFSQMAKRLRWACLGPSILAGLFLLFAGTSGWRSPSKYVRFLLPHEVLTISIPAQQQVTNPQVIVQFVKTSLGDVSYEEIKYQGWKRVGDQLILKDLSNNEFTWSGKTGEEAVVIFKKSPTAGIIDISWNGFTEQVDLSAEKERNFPYKHTFAIPFYASRAMLLFLVVIPFIVISCAAGLLLWDKKAAFLHDLGASSLNRSVNTASNASANDHAASAKLTSLEWLLVFGMVVLAILLRAFNLDSLQPYTDEYAHLIAAKDILGGAPLDSVYQRSLYTVTLPVALFFKIFGTQLWSARLAGVLFNALAILPLYLITRKINRQTALISCFLYATSPWIIAVSRNVREYAYYPFYYYWILYGMILFIRQFPDHFVILHDWKKLGCWKIWLLALALSIPIIFTIIDIRSTFKIILIGYAVFFLFILGKFDLRNKSNLLLIGGSACGILIGIYVLNASGNNYLSYLSRPNVDSYLFRYFFKNPAQQWFFDKWSFLFAAALLGAMVLSILIYRLNVIPSFFLILFSVSILFFIFYFTSFRYFRLRYIFSLQLWYIVLIAIGLYGLSVFLQLVYPPRKKVVSWLVIALLILSFNGSQVLLPTYYSQSGYMPITEEYHDDVVTVHTYLLENVQKNDVLISTIYGSYVHWKDSPEFRELYYFDYTNPHAEDYVRSIVEQNDSGWIVLDARRLKANRALPLDTVSIGDKEVEYLGMFGDQHLWRWDVNAASVNTSLRGRVQMVWGNGSDTR